MAPWEIEGSVWARCRHSPLARAVVFNRDTQSNTSIYRCVRRGLTLALRNTGSLIAIDGNFFIGRGVTVKIGECRRTSMNLPEQPEKEKAP